MGCVDRGGTDGAGAKTGCIEEHVAAHQPTVQFGATLEDHALVGDMDGLPSQVKQHDAQQQCRHRVGELGDASPRRRQQRKAERCRLLAAASVSPPARPGGGQRTCHPDKSKRANRRVRKVVRRDTQGKHDGAPKGTECREHEESQNPPNLKDPL